MFLLPFSPSVSNMSLIFHPKKCKAQVCFTDAVLCSVQSVELCEFLLQHGANVNAQVRTVGT
jgi:hypothetical protein